MIVFVLFNFIILRNWIWEVRLVFVVKVKWMSIYIDILNGNGIIYFKY